MWQKLFRHEVHLAAYLELSTTLHKLFQEMES